MSKEICPKGKESWWPSPVDHDQRDQLLLSVRQLLRVRPMAEERRELRGPEICERRYRGAFDQGMVM